MVDNWFTAINSNEIVGTVLLDLSKAFDLVKGERNVKTYCASKWRTLQTMNFYTNLIKIGGELRKLWTIQYVNIGGMCTAILNI